MHRKQLHNTSLKETLYVHMRMHVHVLVYKQASRKTKPYTTLGLALPFRKHTDKTRENGVNIAMHALMQAILSI